MALLCGLLTVLMAVTCMAQDNGPYPAAPIPDAQPYVSAQDYGIQPGMDLRKVGEWFDCTDALQKALDEAGRGMVFIPAGQYRVTRPLKLKAGQTLCGSGTYSTMITSNDPGNVLELVGIGGPMTVVRDMTITAPIGGNWECTGILLRGGNGIVLENLWVAGWRHAIQVFDSTDVWLNNIVFELNRYGIHLEREGDSKYGLMNVRVHNCYGYQNQRSNILIRKGYQDSVDQCWSTGCPETVRLIDCESCGVSNCYGNRAGPRWDYGIIAEGCNALSLTGNVFDMLKTAIMLDRCKMVTVQGNSARDSAGTAIVVKGCEGVSLTGNSLANSRLSGMLLEDSSHLAILGNMVQGYGLSAEGGPHPAIYLMPSCEEIEAMGNQMWEPGPNGSVG